MTKCKMFAGIDVSKKTFDVALLSADYSLNVHQCFEQGPNGFKQFAGWLKQQGVDSHHTLFCNGSHRGVLHPPCILFAQPWL
jgi:hypothetical protein